MFQIACRESLACNCQLHNSVLLSIDCNYNFWNIDNIYLCTVQTIIVSVKNENNDTLIVKIDTQIKKVMDI